MSQDLFMSPGKLENLCEDSVFMKLKTMGYYFLTYRPLDFMST